MRLNDRVTVEELLQEIGTQDDSTINLADAALSLAALDSPGLSIERYQHHVTTMEREVAERYEALMKEGADDNTSTQLAALKHVLCDVHGYEGDTQSYDDLQNANLIRVIERRKGLPVSLSILCIHLGLKQGWQVEALSFPAHVICRIEKNGERLLFDPFGRCKIMQAADLRQLLKTLVDPQAELMAAYYEPSTNRELLIRLQNNIKLRQIEEENYKDAVKTVERMRMIAPEEHRLLLDAGVLYARTNQALAAVDSLEKISGSRLVGY